MRFTRRRRSRRNGSTVRKTKSYRHRDLPVSDTGTIRRNRRIWSNRLHYPIVNNRKVRRSENVRDTRNNVRRDDKQFVSSGFVPRCRVERNRIRRSYFAYLATGRGKLARSSSNRFTQKCKES